MGRDGFTGIDRDRAEEDIHNFDYEAICVLCSLNNKFGGFLEFLSQNWASPNAETYTKKLGNDMHEIVDEFSNKELGFVGGAYRAANHLLEANGETPIKEFYNTGYHRTDYKICGTTLDNKTGMDTGAVTDELSAFNMTMSGWYKELADLPDGIAFYDPDGELVEVYKSGLSLFKSRVTDLVDPLIKDMNGFVDNEAHVIFTSKKKAADEIPAQNKG